MGASGSLMAESKLLPEGESKFDASIVAHHNKMLRPEYNVFDDEKCHGDFVFETSAQLVEAPPSASGSGEEGSSDNLAEAVRDVAVVANSWLADDSEDDSVNPANVGDEELD